MLIIMSRYQITHKINFKMFTHYFSCLIFFCYHYDTHSFNIRLSFNIISLCRLNQKRIFRIIQIRFSKVEAFSSAPFCKRFLQLLTFFFYITINN